MLSFSYLKAIDEGIIGSPHRIDYLSILHQNDDQGGSAMQCNKTKIVTYIILR